MKKYFILLLCCFAVLPAFSAPVGWIQDFDVAQKQAVQQKKNMLVFFTGSDWCGLCRNLESNVLTKKEFQNIVKRDYIFVYIDSPRDKKRIPEKARTQNPKLFKKYAVGGTPTILLMTSDGGVFGRSAYRNVSAKEYAAGIVSQTKASVVPNLRISVKHLQKGEKRARMIDAVLSKLSPDLQRANMDLVEEICAADPDGKLGMRGKYFEATQLNPVLTEVGAVSNALFAAGINSRGKSDAEKAKIMKEVREKNRPKLLGLREKLVELNKIAPPSAKKSISDTLAGISVMLGE